MDSFVYRYLWAIKRQFLRQRANKNVKNYDLGSKESDLFKIRLIEANKMSIADILAGKLWDLVLLKSYFLE